MEPTDNRPDRPVVPPITAPTGIDLHPAPRATVHISKRAGLAIILVVVSLLFAFAWGGYRRSLQNQTNAREAGMPRSITPAHADDELLRDIPPADASAMHPGGGLTPRKPNPLQAPGPMLAENTVPPEALPKERIVVRQAPTRIPRTVRPHPSAAPAVDRALAAAWQLEHEAMLAPTAIRTGSTLGTSSKPGPIGSLAATEPGANLADIGKALSLGRTATSAATPLTETDYEAQNAQTRKAAFLREARSRSAAEDYLPYTREAPLSRYEIKAGWEIPAVLEQGLNSDLPGELKALVTSNVYDTATGQYLLIPQGSRLIGKYDSRISYGQDGVQVVWKRIIFPDASSIDLEAMMGLDAHGNAGLRDKVDRHYKRLVGMSVLTSMFMAAFAVSQNRTQTILTYPTPTQAAEAALGQELSQTGAQITRRNMNVQPTIKIPAGYRFTVRVNRDILFEAPYEPVRPQMLQPLPQNSAFNVSR